MRNIVNPFTIRSFHFIPSIIDKYFEKILTLEGENKPDGLIFDLEDSVHDDFKIEARNKLVKFFDCHPEIFDKYVVSVRVNNINSEWFEEDVSAVNKFQPHFILLPKTTSARDINFLRSKTRSQQIFVAVETLEGISNIDEILAAMKQTDLFVIGYEDLSACLLIERPELFEANPLNHLLMSAFVAARRHNICIIDAVSRKFGDSTKISQFEKECLYTSTLRFSGKVSVHPTQIAPINAYFEKQSVIKEGDEILEKFNTLTNGTAVIINKDNEMLDTPSIKLYKKIKKDYNA